jgi:hypothetical protein
MIKRFIIDGKDRYAIDFQKQANGTIKLVAVEHPPDPHGLPVTEHHLYSSGAICITAGHEPKTDDRARAIAVHWMHGWSEYVRTGRFPKGPRRVMV